MNSFPTVGSLFDKTSLSELTALGTFNNLTQDLAVSRLWYGIPKTEKQKGEGARKFVSR